MKTLPIAALVCCACLIPGLTPAARAATDPRVSETRFREDGVVEIATRGGFQTTVAFADGERVENIAIGSSGMWQVTPNRRADRLFIKPASATAQPTNMTVITDRRTYLFALRATAGGTPLFLLRFTYPPETAKPSAATAPVTAAAATPASPNPAASRIDPATLNFRWSSSGVRSLLPERVFDDGQSVYLAWAAGQPMPAILTPGPDGKQEGMVNYTSADGVIVVDGVPARLVLRSGKAVAYLDRQPPAIPPAPATGPSSAVTTDAPSAAKAR
ncbi:TrbG/VirB9 family P-type conjugative transfer protein [Novosphingobium sp.]|uniref:TrbG/VirB9 family P-type conjugative transfer protein n=1 Tax=Novosphingobium sp. TaxID=1874826 RepID=UPI00263148A4|nr:TrbG/VirB9 family P-type conjugative transfer protein [Novosphingobium sp.]